MRRGPETIERSAEFGHPAAHKTSTRQLGRISMRRSVAVFAAAAAAVAAIATPASAQQKIVWNHNVFGPPRAVTAGLEAMAAFFKKESNGNFEIKINFGATLGPERQVPEAIKSAGYESGMLCVGYFPGKLPLTTVLELPFLPPAGLAANAVVNEAVLNHPAIVKEMAERWNMKYFGPTFLPPYEFMGNKRIAGVGDMKGVKMRISGLNAKSLQKFGAVPTMVTAPESYTAIERGTIDMLGFPYAYTFGAYKTYEVSKYVTEGIGLGGFMCFQGVSNDAWNKMPKALQDKMAAKMPQAWAASDEALLKAYKAADEKWIPIFHEKLEVNKFPASERQKLEAGANTIWEEWVKEQEADGRPGREMLDFVKKLAAKHATN
jgi:TRAP-type C4-dicarboxylate transport system substrate-binding protein